MHGGNEGEALAEPFKGITRDGTVTPDLYPIRATGVSTEPVRVAATAFLAALTAEQRAATLFPVEDEEWRKWTNVHASARQGVSLEQMTDGQRQAAFDLLVVAPSGRNAGLSVLQAEQNNGNDYGKDLLRQHYLTHPH